MTTLAQIKTLVAPLLARNTDLVRVGQLIAVKPVHHLLRGIFIDRTGDRERCRPRWMATELFDRIDSLPLGLGELLRHPDGLWWISNPDLPQTLVEVAERDVLPMLRQMQSIGDYQRIAIKRDPENYPYYAAADILCLLADGKLDKAADVLATQERAAGAWMPPLRDLHLDGKLLRKERLSMADRARLAGLLHEWEAYTVDKLKLRDIWEPTPFPLETGDVPHQGASGPAGRHQGMR